MKGWRTLSTLDIVVDVCFVGMWLVQAIGDFRGGDWMLGLVHLWTGVVIALFIARQQYSHRAAQRTIREYQKLTDDDLHTMLAITTIMQHQQADPKQIKEHLQN